MKKILVVTLLLLNLHLNAQDSEKRNDLFKGKIHSSGYGALSTQYSKFNGEDAIFTGTYGGWMINHKLMIGLGGYGLVTRHSGYAMDGEGPTANKLKMGYGGLMLEYTFFQKKKIHISTNLLVGVGAVVNAYHSQPDSNGDSWQSDEESGFRVLQPSVNIETDITPWFRVAIGGGYRYVTGADMSGISNHKMSAPTANVSLKFGVF